MAEFTDVTRRSLLRATGAGLALSVAGCLSGDEGETPPGDTDPESIERGGRFTVGLSDDLGALNVLTASSAPTNALLDLLYQPGVLVDPDGFEAMPWVFPDWDARETTDGMEVRFSVREDLRWTDGEPLTVEDVRFTYEYYVDRGPGRVRSVVDPIESIGEATGEYDLALSLDRVVGAYASEQLSLRLLPQHVWRDVDDHTAHDPEAPVGLGPGRVVSGDRETGFELSLVDDWPLTRQDWIEDHPLFIHGGPFLDSLEVRLLANRDALHRELLGGGIDAMDDGGFDPAQAPAIDEREGLGLIDGHDDGYSHYTINMRVPPLDDRAFRQALSMAMDRRRWVEGMMRGYAIPGSVVVPPGFEHLRPEASAGEPVQGSPDEGAHPALEALWFREEEDGDLDVAAVRDFLESGSVVSGAAGTYAGREYPGSLTGIDVADRTGATYDYGFGAVRSSVLEEAGIDRELYVDGRTVKELNGGPITMLSVPPDANPRAVEFTQEYVRNVRLLGIPIELEVATANSIADRAYLEADFDIYPGEWAGLSADGVSSLYDLFHSDNAHAEDSTFDTFGYNAAGYGLAGLPRADRAIEEARGELDPTRRAELVREVAERIYLDAPTLVRSYRWPQWPVNTADFAGFLPSIPGLGSSNLWMQALTVHRR
jgi:peptide/nickel transport system substrate-binding protein